MALVTYVLLSMLVGFLAIGWPGGFFFYFVISLIVSPLLGLAFLILTTSGLRRGKCDSRGDCCRHSSSGA
ncbi:hypothetical protein JCM17961_14230 [Endothiovibrio diazotrophicus]